MAPGVSGNEKKFRALIADFVTTTAELGATIDPEVVTVELRQRVQLLAAQISVTEATVLRNHIPTSWGRDMARQTYRHIQQRDAPHRRRTRPTTTTQSSWPVDRRPGPRPAFLHRQQRRRRSHLPIQPQKSR